MTDPRPGGAGPVIELRGVSRWFGDGPARVWACREVDLTIRAGTFACLYGASGSGKSTLLNVVAGLSLPDAGEVQVAGVRVDEAPDAVRARLRLERVGVVFQEYNLVDEFTAAENVMLPLEVAGVSAADAREQALMMLGRLGLGELGNRYPAELSGGQRQRVAIARGLSGERAVLVADEPTGALDTANSIALFAQLRAVASSGTAVLLATHDPRAAEFADLVFDVDDGRVRARAAITSGGAS